MAKPRPRAHRRKNALAKARPSRKGVRRRSPAPGRRPLKYVYFFGGGKADGDRTMKDLLGGKGSGLAEMTNAGLPVPPGFTISTAACMLFYTLGRRVPTSIDLEMERHVRRLEKAAGATLGSADNPLLVSVRSGAKFSMPGMMDTILNLGLNDRIVEGLKRRTANGRFAFDSYRRFIQMFGNVVLEISKDAFEAELEAVKHASGVRLDTELDEAALRHVVGRYEALIRTRTHRAFPQDPGQQLRMARDAVFRSWQNPRAKEYRRIYDIPDEIGTAVNVQMMVFGNAGDRSATGVGFTRNPATGEKEFYGEFLVNAQGEDVVAGIRTPQPIQELARLMPKAYTALRRITARLERHYRDVQDFEFTIQDEQLFMLQTRSGKRTGQAAVVIATDLVSEKLITPKQAIQLVDPESLSQLLAPVFRSGRLEAASGRRQRLTRLAGRRIGTGRVHGGRCRAVDKRGQVSGADSEGDGAGRHPRHVRRPRHPDRDRRDDLTRSRRRSPDGQAVHRGCRRPKSRGGRAPHVGGGSHGSRG